jgi:hypothetical protein
LVQRWPKSDLEKDVDGCLPLHVTLSAAADSVPGGGPSTAAVIQSLVQRSPESMRTADHRGRLPIHHAAGRRVRDKDISDDLDVMRLVLDLGSHALLELQDNNGNLHLHAALSWRTSLE